MGMVRYYNEDDEKTHICDEKEFVAESGNIPFETVLGIANSHETIREILYRKLLLRAKEGQYPEILRRSPYFEDLEGSVLDSNNEEEKVHLALYIDNDLIDSYYGGVENLIDRITKINPKNIMPLDLAAYLVDASKYDVDEETIEKIKKGITNFVDLDYQEMMELIDEYPFPNLDQDKLDNTRNRYLSSFLSKLEKNTEKVTR